MPFERYVNPVEIMQDEEPETLELLPRGAEDLTPELGLMAAEAYNQGRLVHFPEDPERFLVPEDICRAVLGKSRTVAEIECRTERLYREGRSQGL